MPPAVARLKRRSDFLRTAASGLKAVQQGLILQVRAHSPKSPKTGADAMAPLRCGFTVSKKVGNAVERNRARRRLKAVAERILLKNAKDGFDFVIIGRKATLSRPFDLLIRDLENALKRIDTQNKKAEQRP